MLNRFTNGEGFGEMGGTRSELLARAEVLIRCRGYNGFSYADLAREVGVRTATIHYYFPTKKDLGLQLIARYDEKYDAALKEIISSTRGGLDRVAAYAELYLSGLEQELGCLCAVLAITPEFLPAEMRAAVGQFFKKHFRWLEMVIREGRADGSIRPDADPALQARLIITLLEGGLLMERMLDGPGGFKCSIAALKSQLEGSTAAPQSRSHPGSMAAELN